jgi:hypothetical protein
MKTEAEVRAAIEKTIASYEHVLVCGPATVEINAPRALMQVEACVRLDTLYGLLGEKRPRFKCDDTTKTNR